MLVIAYLVNLTLYLDILMYLLGLIIVEHGQVILGILRAVDIVISDRLAHEVQHFEHAKLCFVAENFCNFFIGIVQVVETEVLAGLCEFSGSPFLL